MERWRDTPLLAALPRPDVPIVEKIRATPLPPFFADRLEAGR